LRRSRGFLGYVHILSNMRRLNQKVYCRALRLILFFRTGGPIRRKAPPHIHINLYSPRTQGRLFLRAPPASAQPFGRLVFRARGTRWHRKLAKFRAGDQDSVSGMLPPRWVRLARQDSYRYQLTPSFPDRLIVPRSAIPDRPWYLRSMQVDFGRICTALKIVMAQSEQDRPDPASALVRSQITFTFGMVAVQFRLSLYRCGFGRMEVTSLVNVFDKMRLELRTFVLAEVGV
jgi:hypothetical protein